MTQTAHWALALDLCFCALAAACSQGEPLEVGAGEPIRVRGAELVQGPLPGAAPAPIDADGGATGVLEPSITDFESQNEVAIPAAAAKKFSGRAKDSAVAVGLRFPDLGSGYWVVPVGPPDPLYPGEISWEANVDFNASIPTGLHSLRVVALDANGHAGTQSERPVCAASRIPDNLNSCEPTNAPPAAVISLQWDADSDLDLQVTTPEGRVVDAKHPTTLSIDAGKPGPGVGVIDRDSLAACVPDGLRQEDLVWQQRPSGTFGVAVNMFDSCKKPGARFVVIVYEAEGITPNRHLVETFRQAGELPSIAANGGTYPGLFVFEYPFG